MTCDSTVRPADIDPDGELVTQFELRTLRRDRWTHQAHLVVCRHAVDRYGAEGALDHLREAIRRYNEAVGTPNTDTSGYHETLTRYYVGAVHASGAAGTQLLDHPWCSRQAPLRWWTPPVLSSVAARRAWVPPDRAPLPWA